VRRIEATVEAERLLADRQRSPEKLYNEICRTVKEEGRGSGVEGGKGNSVIGH
jgi:hypothetical protein